VKVTNNFQKFNIYSNNGLKQPFKFSCGVTKSPNKDVFEFSETKKYLPSFSGLSGKAVIGLIPPPKTPLLLTCPQSAAKDLEGGAFSFYSRSLYYGKKIMDTFAGFFGQKLKGKKQLKIGNEIFDLHITTQDTSVFVERGGDMEISATKVGGNRAFSLFDKKASTQLIHDGASSYRMTVKDGDLITTVDTIFTKNDAKHATTILSTTKDASGKIIEVSERGCNGQGYTYNFITGDYIYRETSGSTPVQKIYKSVILRPDEVAYSQKCVNEEGFIKLRDAMAKEGWTREPINVIRMPDGHLVSLDNRRLRAAIETGTPIRAVIHDASEELPPMYRVRHQISDPETREVVAKPKTWGEIIYNRLLQNGFIKDGTIEYSTKIPDFGDKEDCIEGSYKLLELYKSGKIPCMS